MNRLGWKKDPWRPEKKLITPFSPVAIPDKFVWDDKYLPAVRDQGNQGACVGFGYGAQGAHWAKRQGCYTEWHSPRWIYNGARFLAGDLTRDVGCYPTDALTWLKNKGMLLEHFWPYVDAPFDKTSPPSKFDPEAAKWPLISWSRVVGDVDGLCTAILTSIVSIGTPWYNIWMNPPRGVLPTVTSSSAVAGGHATFLYGFDRTAKVFLGQNSWGSSWGDAGHYIMAFSAVQVFKSDGGYDAHVIEVNWGEPVPPDPPPVPPGPTDDLAKRIAALETSLSTAKGEIATLKLKLVNASKVLS